MYGVKCLHAIRSYKDKAIVNTRKYTTLRRNICICVSMSIYIISFSSINCTKNKYIDLKIMATLYYVGIANIKRRIQGQQVY